MQLILRIIISVLSAYMLLLFIRILLSWFSGPSLGKPVQLLHQVTDPYLAIFRKIRFLRAGRMDFSPIAAIIVLVTLLNITNTLAVYGKISVGIILSLIVSAVWSAAIFIFVFFIILCSIRFLALLFGVSTFSPFWQTIDVIVNPVLAYIQRTVFRNRNMNYQMGLGLSIAILAAVAFLSNLVVRQIAGLLLRIPF